MELVIVDVANVGYGLSKEEISERLATYLRTKLAKKVVEALINGITLFVVVPLTDEGTSHLFQSVLSFVERVIEELRDLIKQRRFNEIRSTVLGSKYVGQEAIAFAFQSSQLRRCVAEVDRYVVLKEIRAPREAENIVKFYKNRGYKIDEDVVRYVILCIEKLGLGERTVVSIEFVTREKHGELCRDLENKDLIENLLRMRGRSVVVTRSRCNTLP